MSQPSHFQPPMTQPSDDSLDPALQAPRNGAQLACGITVCTMALVRLRRTPGHANKAADDVLMELPKQTPMKVLAGPQPIDGLVWWQVAGVDGRIPTGWMAASSPVGLMLLQAVGNGIPLIPSSTKIEGGDLLVTTTRLRVRRTPGARNKGSDDLFGEFLPKTTLNVIEGPQQVDGVNWWRVGGILVPSGDVIGWVAESSLTDGSPLIACAPKLPSTDIPNKATGSYLGSPVQGVFAIAQLWGENSQIYSRITYDGVPLLGHNGIDFATPNGTTLLAIDDALVDAAVMGDPSGFGNYVKLRHPWGESIYAHMQALFVQVGQQIKRGFPIGLSNNSGFSTGPHLHFAIRIAPYQRTDGWGGFSDPLPYLAPAVRPLPAWVLPSATPRGPQTPTPDQRIPGVGYAPDQPGLVRP